MDAYVARVYAARMDAFFRQCLVICDSQDEPRGTAFLWQTRAGSLNTVHWLKVRQDAQGKGLGRALLSHMFRGIGQAHYPVYLHTHPQCVAAIHLYTAFGFDIIKGPAVGSRSNDWEQGLQYLAQHMEPGAWQALRLSAAPSVFYQALAATTEDEF